jgi:outer membrane protein TolC
VLQAQIDRNAQQAQYYIQENSFEAAKANLNNLLQRNADILFDVADSISLIPNFSVDTTELFLRQHNPSLMIANRNVDVEYSILQQNRSLYYPHLDLNAGYSYSNSTSNASFFLTNKNQGWTAGLTLSWNIFNGFTTRNQVEISKINVSNAHLQYRQLLSQTNTALNTGWRDYKTALKEMLLLRENLKLSMKICSSPRRCMTPCHHTS